ncbi:MAG: Unknown protein [uncultured Sulfurovum sp.]|uniref:ABC-type transport auxiliary lipoprotein component domain-containing protein n=1 Tax=uncultured Sulfurovum sp. TaxID=269237 RepID=A0A6S6T6R9_9BACT|nr:MAG: Unknown protein [uncultured Sulfurovum sp.]
MKNLFLILVLLLFTACASKKFYTLGEQLDVRPQTTQSEHLDVLTVTVPKYLKEHKIVRQITAYQIELIDEAHWLIPMEKKLTQMLIEYLEQSMNNPNVHLYPWEGSEQSSKRISLTIKRFIASNEEVHLKANYSIIKLNDNRTQTKTFETKVKSSKKIEEMIKAMEKAYLELLENIANTLNNK